MEMMTNNDYEAIALKNKVWLQGEASAKLEGIEIDSAVRALAGRYFVGEISHDELHEQACAHVRTATT